MTRPLLFPFSEYWWFYAGFTALVLMLLALDLGVFHRKAHVVSMREAITWTAVWVTLAMTFNFVFYRFMLRRFALDARLAAHPGFDPSRVAFEAALEFLAGYITEYSLSVDNVFVFVVVMSYFAVPDHLQHRVLFFGILGALVFRAMFISAGAVLLRFEPVVYLFGVILLATGIRIMSEDEKRIKPDRNPVIRLFRRFVPLKTEYAGQQFFLRAGRRVYATPLIVALLFLEMTDIVFAVDSVPAIFALTREPLIVFTSNIFAILGLRSMYFLLSGAVDKFHMLKYGLGVVLIFVGLKMVWLNRLFGGHFPISVSLGIIVGVIAVSIALSFVFPRAAEAHREGSARADDANEVS